jgi:hypothetical protein
MATADCLSTLQAFQNVGWSNLLQVGEADNKEACGHEYGTAGWIL